MKKLRMRVLHETATGVLAEIEGEKQFLSKHGLLYKIFSGIVKADKADKAEKKDREEKKTP